MTHRVLVLCEDTWHPAATVQRGLAALGDVGFTFDFLEDGAKWSASLMREFSLVILAKANITSARVSSPWLGLDSQRSFFDYVGRGNGLLVIHGGSSRYDHLPIMSALIGGTFKSHPDQCTVTVLPQPYHPIAVGLGPFAIQDEHYFMEMQDAQVQVFLLSRSEHGLQPAGWTRTEGAGRVCVLTPGHNLEVWLHPAFQKLLLNALRWTGRLN